MAKHEHCQSIFINTWVHLEVGNKVNLNYAVDEDEGPQEDLNEHEVRKEASAGL